jgi:sugar transferase (PEP-CTERM/EpsH1 system associated)
MADPKAPPPLIAHIVYRFDVGGLENGLVNLVNRIPADRYRHVILSLTESSAFESRLTQPGVHVIPLHKRSGNDWRLHARLWKMLRQLKPAIVHTRNLPTLEYQVTAWTAGVKARVHGEHGRDTYDLKGAKPAYNVFRRMVRPLIKRYVAVSRDLEGWLASTVKVRRERLTQIYNGVDTNVFEPRLGGVRPQVLPARFAPGGSVVFGTVGRLQTVKDQTTLARAFVELLKAAPSAREVARLAIVGDGPLRADCESILREGNAFELAWLPGVRTDVARCLQAFDVFVLPSIAEGISNTILEAMASGLPVIATSVGGNPELVVDGQTGTLVPASDPVAMAAAMRRYLDDRGLISRHGEEGRRVATARFALDAMVAAYVSVYDAVLARTG